MPKPLETITCLIRRYAKRNHESENEETRTHNNNWNQSVEMKEEEAVK